MILRIRRNADTLESVTNIKTGKEKAQYSQKLGKVAVKACIENTLHYVNIHRIQYLKHYINKINVQYYLYP